MEHAKLVIPLQWVRDLVVSREAGDQRPAFVSSASGLIQLREHFYSVADDENFLMKFNLDPLQRVQAISLRQEFLPLDEKDRKKVKADFECLATDGENILVVPSGSTIDRRTGFFINSKLIVTPTSFEHIYAKLNQQFSNLNIEGSFYANGFLYLFNRGNANDLKNAMIKIRPKFPLTEDSVVSVKPIELPVIDGVALTLTDAAYVTNDKIWFLAAAENTKNTYDDGEFVGAVIGCMNELGQVQKIFHLNCTAKPEGLCLDLLSNSFMVATDADNPKIPSQILRGLLPE